jgi:hypothetical protein
VESDGDSDDDSDSEESSQERVLTLKEQLKMFDKLASTGQLFLKYTGKRRRKPQDRIVKVSFDNKYKPKQISWGSGSRHIDFSDILYIAHGHWTPVFQARKDSLDELLCFSVVAKQRILDVQAQTKQMTILWVKGLRKLIGQNDEQALKLCKQHLQTQFRNLDLDLDEERERERIWDIDQTQTETVRDRFNAKMLYEQALRGEYIIRSQNSRSFGSRDIHAKLTIQQLNQLLSVYPYLITNKKFLEIYLFKLMPARLMRYGSFLKKTEWQINGCPALKREYNDIIRLFIDSHLRLKSQTPVKASLLLYLIKQQYTANVLCLLFYFLCILFSLNFFI